MKRTLLGLGCCFLAVLWAGPVEAQTGVKGGLVWAELKQDPEAPDDAFGRRSGWAGGIFMRFDLGPLTGQTEALYTQRGAEIGGEGVVGDPEIQMTFVEVPVLLRLGSGGTALYGGGYGAVKLDAKLVTDDSEVDLAPEIEDLDYGLVFGASIGLGAVEIEGRTTIGLRNLAKDPNVPEIKHRAISVLAGISF